MLSGAACLGFILVIQTYYLKRTALKGDGSFAEATLKDKGSWLSSMSLVIYALFFSLAYVELETGTGALILFSAVQLTMIGWGIYKKEKLTTLQWIAFIVAVSGFVYLMLPSAAMPSLLAATLMATSGAAWGIYSIRGKTCTSPLRATGFNFIRSLIAVPILLLVGMSYFAELSTAGVLIAIAAGAIASGIGYSIWYAALPLLKTSQAAIVQLCVPVLAAILGIVFLSEPLTLTFIIASTIILGAVLVFIVNNKLIKA